MSTKSQFSAVAMPRSTRSRASIGNWPDPMNARIGNWPDPMNARIGNWPDPMGRTGSASR
jgi:hypothetical protein